MKNHRNYRYIVCEILEAPTENSRHKIRAKPLAGQCAGPEYRIECPLGIRNHENVGEYYRFIARFKDTYAAPQLYTSYHLAGAPTVLSHYVREAAEALRNKRDPRSGSRIHLLDRIAQRQSDAHAKSRLKARTKQQKKR
jgi:hypothetical protein